MSKARASVLANAEVGDDIDFETLTSMDKDIQDLDDFCGSAEEAVKVKCCSEVKELLTSFRKCQTACWVKAFTSMPCEEDDPCKQAVFSSCSMVMKLKHLKLDDEKDFHGTSEYMHDMLTHVHVFHGSQ